MVLPALLRPPAADYGRASRIMITHEDGTCFRLSATLPKR